MSLIGDFKGRIYVDANGEENYIDVDFALFTDSVYLRSAGQLEYVGAAVINSGAWRLDYKGEFWTLPYANENPIAMIRFVLAGKPKNRVGTNSGHGYIWERPDARSIYGRDCVTCRHDASLL